MAIARDRITKDGAFSLADKRGGQRKIPAERAIVDAEPLREAIIPAQDLPVESEIKGV